MKNSDIIPAVIIIILILTIGSCEAIKMLSNESVKRAYIENGYEEITTVVQGRPVLAWKKTIHCA